MNGVIFIASLILFIALAINIFNALNVIEIKKRILLVTGGIFICFIFTVILFNISANVIQYSNIEQKETVKKMIISIFTPINGIILLPIFMRTINGLKSNEITTKEANKKIGIIIIMIIVLFIVENIYFQNIQNGIMNYTKK